MQEEPPKIEENIDEEEMGLSEEELSDEAEIKTKEELPREAAIKAEEEESAAAMREVAHRTKEKALEQGGLDDDLEEEIQPTTDDGETSLEPEEEKEQEAPSLAQPKNFKPPFSLQRKAGPVLEKPVAPLNASPASFKAPAEPIPAAPAHSLEVMLSFLLGQQSISLEDLQLLSEEKIITLGGSDFQVQIQLQEKTIAEAQLVMVEGVPSLQITKMIAS